MEKGGWIFLAFLALQLLSSSSQDASKWLSIDCGNDEISFQNLLLWDTDSNYIRVGSNKLVLKNATRDEFNTLRAFPNNTRNNCYTVPTEKQKIRHIVRVGFYYGNYDGLSKPPTFNLLINNLHWTTINTSINNGEPFYEEIIYQNKESGFFKICLVQIKDGGIPFLNSIEIMAVLDELYPKMETNATYKLVTRVNLGGPEVRYDIAGTDEIYNRVWSMKALPYASISGFPDLLPIPENHPPITVLRNAIEFNASDPMTLTINLPESTLQSAYIVLYIINLHDDFYNPNKSAQVKIEIDNQDQGMVDALHYCETTVVTKYPVNVSGPAINIKLSPADEVNYPPMIAAMEVFTKWGSDKSAAAPKYFSLAYLLIILFMLFLVE